MHVTTLEKQWEQIQAGVCKLLDQPKLEGWADGIACVDISKDKISLALPNAFLKERFQERYQKVFAEVIKEVVKEVRQVVDESCDARALLPMVPMLGTRPGADPGNCVPVVIVGASRSAG